MNNMLKLVVQIGSECQETVGHYVYYLHLNNTLQVPTIFNICTAICIFNLLNIFLKILLHICILLLAATATFLAEAFHRKL